MPAASSWARSATPRVSTRRRSEVLYRDGQARAARAVANRLGIDKTAPVDSVNEEIAGSFDVIVLVGSDRGG